MANDDVRDGELFKKMKERFEAECEKNGVISASDRVSLARFLSENLPHAMARVSVMVASAEDIAIVGEALRDAAKALVEDVEREEKGQKT